MSDGAVRLSHALRVNSLGCGISAAFVVAGSSSASAIIFGPDSLGVRARGPREGTPSSGRWNTSVSENSTVYFAPCDLRVTSRHQHRVRRRWLLRGFGYLFGPDYLGVRARGPRGFPLALYDFECREERRVHRPLCSQCRRAPPRLRLFIYVFRCAHLPLLPSSKMLRSSCIV